MEQIKERFASEIAARLAGAAESGAKAEMIEELAENLTRRYEDMTGAGVGAEDAFAQAMDELGDPAELVAYLESLEPDEARQGPSDGADALLQGVFAAGKTVLEEARKAVRLAQEQMKRSRWQEREAASPAEDAAGWADRSIPSQGLTALDVETVNIDVNLYLDPDPAAAVRVEGNAERLDIFTAGGTLTVRERFTASSQFFSFRGLSGADVALTIPGRRWESIRVATVSGDVDMGDELDVGKLEVRTASGDLDCRVRSCAALRFKSAGGDMDLSGNVERLEVETASGDVELRGPIGEASVIAASGDVDLTGSVVRARVKSMSGDVTVESMTQPMGLELASKSGDVDVRIPDAGPFAVRMNTVSGERRCDFPFRCTEDAGPDDPRPRYVLSSVSGDVTLRKY